MFTPLKTRLTDGTKKHTCSHAQTDETHTCNLQHTGSLTHSDSAAAYERAQSVNILPGFGLGSNSTHIRNWFSEEAECEFEASKDRQLNFLLHMTFVSPAISNLLRVSAETLNGQSAAPAHARRRWREGATSSCRALTLIWADTQVRTTHTHTQTNTQRWFGDQQRTHCSQGKGHTALTWTCNRSIHILDLWNGVHWRGGGGEMVWVKSLIYKVLDVIYNQ